MSKANSISWDEAMEMELARLETNLHFVVDYSTLMQLTAVEFRAKECLSNIEEIKKYLALHERREKEGPPVYWGHCVDSNSRSALCLILHHYWANQMLYFNKIVREVLASESSLWSKAVALFVWVVAEVAFVCFLAWIFYVVSWYLDSVG